MSVIPLKIVVSVAVLAAFVTTYSQTSNNSALISVNLSIVGKGTPTLCSDSSNYYFANLTISNTQDTTIRFWIMSCSWPIDNWLINNNAVSLRFCGCDSNIPVEVVLSPQKSIEFYSAIKYHRKDSSGVRIRAGFLYFTSARDIFNNAGTTSKNINRIKFWSNEVELKDNLYSYEIR